MVTVEVSSAPGGDVVVRPAGELDLSHVDALWAGVEQALASQPTSVVIDLGSVTFCDSSILSVFLRGAKEGAEAGTRVVLRDPRPNVRRVLQLSGLDGVLDVVDRGASAGSAP